ncbi:MAG TPA: hypothetical protein VGG02_09835 [Chthoniobacterales bacterium]|jgi:hypothetical protein
MQAKAQIISERHESYTGKRGKVEQTILSCLDLDGTHPFLNTFDFVFNEDEAKTYGGKLVGKTVQLGVTSFEPAFGGRLRAKGQILGVAGNAPPRAA